MRMLVTGATGQVGAALLPRLARLGEVVAPRRAALDLSQADSIVRAVREARPEVILNPAALTVVDEAEAQPALAHAVNALAPGLLAEEAKRLGALLVQYSTDYVFDGALRRPYVESDAPNPLSTYGNTKLEGETRVRESGCRHLILRTSWVYGGPAAFPMLILQKARRGEKLRMVTDQTSVPTWASDVARLTGELLGGAVEGTWHASAAGEVSRYDYAAEVLRMGGVRAVIEPIRSAEFPSPAKRPAYSVLASGALERASGVPAIGAWRERLAACLGAPA